MATISLPSPKAGRKKHPLEVEEQKACWAWLATVGLLPERDADTHTLQDYSYMVPNGTQLGGGRTRRAMYMASLKAQGLKPGVSDIVIAYPIWLPTGGQCLYPGAYIELKRDVAAYKGPAALKAAVRPEQATWARLMFSVGYFVAVAYGVDHFKELVNSYLAHESPPPLDSVPSG